MSYYSKVGGARFGVSPNSSVKYRDELVGVLEITNTDTMQPYTMYIVERLLN